MDNDDKIVGKILSRREALNLLGMVAAAALVACQPDQAETAAPTTAATQGQAPTNTSGAAQATNAPTQGAAATEAGASITEEAAASTQVSGLPACIVRPELTEGPFFVDEGLNRSDIRPDPATGAVSEGTPLKIIVRTSRIDATACTVFEGVTVDVWHCDADGVYSDVQNAVGQKFLRGHQVTNENGVAEFTTIYPGWYPGRAVHIHFKLRTNPDAQSGEEFTSQWFFDETVTDVVHAEAPYNDKGYRNVLNSGDGIFQQAGDQMILQVSPEGDGYVATFDVGLQMG